MNKFKLMNMGEIKLRNSHKCGFAVAFFCVFISATATADGPTLDLEIDDQRYDFRIESSNRFTIQNSDVTVTISLDRKKKIIEISTENPTGISVAEYKFTEGHFDRRNARAELIRLLRNKNIRVNGKSLESNGYFSFEESDTLLNSPSHILASQKIDILSLIGIESAHASMCSDVCSSEIFAMGIASAYLTTSCSAAAVGGPIAWANCFIALGAEVWAADALATCLEDHPAQCRVFYSQE